MSSIPSNDPAPRDPKGTSLTERLRQGALTADEVVSLRDRLASGLAEAHREGVIHRNICPDNVILPDEQVTAAKLIGFDLSKPTDPNQEGITGTDIVDNYGFASPEQFGLYSRVLYGRVVDERSDIYSLGLTLAAAALGRPLDMGDSFEDALRARQSVPDLTGAPMPLRPWLAAMLEPDPTKRPANIGALMAGSGGATRVSGKRRTALAGVLVIVFAGGVAVYSRFWPVVPLNQTNKLPVIASAAKNPVPHHPPAAPLGDQLQLGSTTGVDTSPGAGNAAEQPVPQDSPATSSSPIASMVSLAGGCFSMGSKNDPEAYSDEVPHQVCVESFAISRFEVSVGEFRRFVEATGYKTMGERADSESRGCYTFATTANQDQREMVAGRSWRDPGFQQDDAHPVVCVALEDAYAYAQWLSTSTGLRFRLPTEAEWEYAARGGTSTRFSWGDTFNSAHGNCRDDVCPDKRKQPTATGDGVRYTASQGRFLPNAYGIHDMSGNVSEWTCSRYSKDYDGFEKSCVPSASAEQKMATRGGSWFDFEKFLRAAARDPLSAGTRNSSLGFRIVKELAHDLNRGISTPSK